MKKLLRHIFAGLLALLLLPAAVRAQNNIDQGTPFSGGAGPGSGRRGGAGLGGPGGAGAPGGRRGSGGPGGLGGGFGGNRAYTIRDPAELQMVENMTKALDPAFINDVYTFSRLKYDYQAGSRGGGRFWDDDSPDADLNLEFRLFQATSLKLHPGYNYIDIDPKQLAKNPFVYMVVKNGMNLTDQDVKVLHDYVMNGGFLMAEDFWGDTMWSVAYQQFKRIFPDREPVELPLSHPIFHTVFDFKYLPQMPSAGRGYVGVSYDPSDYAASADYPEGDHYPHYYAFYDDHGHIAALICRNNHYGDGWEHEGDNHEYFDKFSMPQAYPMFINILYYALTN